MLTKMKTWREFVGCDCQGLCVDFPRSGESRDAWITRCGGNPEDYTRDGRIRFFVDPMRTLGGPSMYAHTNTCSIHQRPAHADPV